MQGHPAGLKSPSPVQHPAPHRFAQEMAAACASPARGCGIRPRGIRPRGDPSQPNSPWKNPTLRPSDGEVTNLHGKSFKEAFRRFKRDNSTSPRDRFCVFQASG